MTHMRLTTFLATAALALSSTSAMAGDSSSTHGYDETSGVLGAVVSTPTTGTTSGQGAVKGVRVSNSGVAPASATAPAAAATPSLPASTGGSGGSLPFTGLDIALVALMGVALVGTGVVLRRGSRQPTS
jgi:hypothetical protein